MPEVWWVVTSTVVREDRHQGLLRQLAHTQGEAPAQDLGGGNLQGKQRNKRDD